MTRNHIHLLVMNRHHLHRDPKTAKQKPDIHSLKALRRV
ncbi:hypothetical protein OESDEN_11791 [Oesophagostomum dentatum]|uniref:Uncharacterized protein n=1 Tax=Oesophagostomum dentatum TaxID=61180 RepID=A0A0B1SY18_OESDE|nr:hypothetical protein OESDEN_11791 [Oesophagostomum dentatum]